MHAGDEAIEKSPALRGRSSEEPVHGRDEPNHLDVIGKSSRARLGLAVDAHDVAEMKIAMYDHLKMENLSDVECKVVKTLVHAIGKRAARLSAVPLAAILIHSGKLQTESMVDVGVDGSLVEFYPNFEGYMREALRSVSKVGEAGEKKVRIGISKDGSGVGAALIALVASKDETLKNATEK